MRKPQKSGGRHPCAKGRVLIFTRDYIHTQRHTSIRTHTGTHPKTMVTVTLSSFVCQRNHVKPGADCMHVTHDIGNITNDKRVVQIAMKKLSGKNLLLCFRVVQMNGSLVSLTPCVIAESEDFETVNSFLRYLLEKENKRFDTYFETARICRQVLYKTLCLRVVRKFTDGEAVKKRATDGEAEEKPKKKRKTVLLTGSV